jgi:hypothetical protein
MKRLRAQIVLALGFGLLVTAPAGSNLLTTDPLTGLPLYRGTDSPLHLGNTPTRLPESAVCQSRMQADFYSVYDSKIGATLAWYDSHLHGFKRTHAYVSGRSQDAYFKPDGRIIVSVTGSAGKEGENTDAYSVTYARLQPGLSRGAIMSLNQQKPICP